MDYLNHLQVIYGPLQLGEYEGCQGVYGAGIQGYQQGD